MRWIKILFFSIVLSAVNAGADVNVKVQANDKVAVQSVFDVQIHLSGTDTVGAFTLHIRFDKNKMQITSITANVDGVIMPDDFASINNNGEFIVAYMSITGFIPGSGKQVITVTCKAETEGSAYFEIASDSEFANSAGYAIKETVENKTVIITSDFDPPDSAIDASLKADDNVSAKLPFNVEVYLSGTKTVGTFDLHIRFDNAKVKITGISPLLSGVVVPAKDKIASVNANGTFTIGYASTSGVIPGSEAKIASMTCEALIEEGETVFEIDNSSIIQSNVIPPEELTGALNNKTVNIHPDSILYAKGDANGDGIISSADALYILHFITGNISSDLLKGNCDVNADGVINAIDALYVLHYVAGNIIEF